LIWGSKNIIKMSQDIISDGLNQIMVGKKMEKRKIVLKKYSKMLLELFEIMKSKGKIDFKVDEENKTVQVEILKLNECRAIKPRYFTGYKGIDKYLRRFLPSRNLGNLVITTNEGLLTHQEAVANKIGGSLIAYFY
jgi:ribosomal protein S8